ncbi:hypothetical protein SAMN05216593_1027 [Pseudomonas asturiensis]|uniref:Uncharacterized protein n=1 Tax=Pseudomonas asturiensis TaxID=1190415 RepID=A0A1M7KC19_9PSED|nr:hypothetical protein [Pseudomonas asturiensis]SHM62765.1 hypothetical protein SAMN05216593_1027 [Pseudomonas asturiensis]
MKLEEMDIAPEIKAQAAELVRRVEQSDGLLELATAGGVTEGFLIGLGFLGTLRPRDIDALDNLFNQAMERKMAEARKQ